MDLLNPGSIFQSFRTLTISSLQQAPACPPARPQLDCRMEVEAKDSSTARKVQKADREKLRRDRLNEQFTELGNTLDPDRPKNDKASILGDTVQMLKDLTDQVNRLKSEYATLTEESHELTQEKNDLREEKASLKSDIDSLNAQYQQRARAMYPWSGMDHSVVMHPSSYAFPMPVPIPTAPIPMHPSLQPYPFYANQNPSVVPNPCPTYMPYMTHNTMIEQQPMHHVPQVIQQDSRSHGSGSGKEIFRIKSSDEESRIEKSDDSTDIGTDLELKTPGSASEQDSSSKLAKKSLKKKTSLIDGGSSSGYSSSHSVQAIPSNVSVGSLSISSNSIVGGQKTEHQKIKGSNS